MQTKARTMRSSRTHSVTLGPLEESLQRRLRSGDYDNASEVLRTALRALDREEAALDEILREKVRASMANKKPSIPAEDVFKGLEARHSRKVKAARRGA
jgi:antitoxin ParD1/3/4